MARGAIRRLALGTAVLTAAGLLTVAAPQDARAAAYCPGRKVGTLQFATGSVLVHRRGGYVCAVTVPGGPGVPQRSWVSVRVRGGRPVVDEGRHAHRAGPVTVHAGQRCVWVKGGAGGRATGPDRALC